MIEKKAKYHPEWRADCSGKLDYDCDLVSLSCRYWPNHSAKASICIGDLATGPYETLACANFDGNTEAEVKVKVELWSKTMIERVDMAIRREFMPTEAEE